MARRVARKAPRGKGGGPGTRNDYTGAMDTWLRRIRIAAVLTRAAVSGACTGNAFTPAAVWPERSRARPRQARKSQ